MNWYICLYQCILELYSNNSNITCNWLASIILVLASKKCFLTSQGLVGAGMSCRALICPIKSRFAFVICNINLYFPPNKLNCNYDKYVKSERQLELPLQSNSGHHHTPLFWYLGFHGNAIHFEIFNTPKASTHRWIFLRCFMKFDERNKRKTRCGCEFFFNPQKLPHTMVDIPTKFHERNPIFF